MCVSVVLGRAKLPLSRRVRKSPSSGGRTAREPHTEPIAQIVEGEAPTSRRVRNSQGTAHGPFALHDLRSSQGTAHGTFALQNVRSSRRPGSPDRAMPPETQASMRCDKKKCTPSKNSGHIQSNLTKT